MTPTTGALDWVALARAMISAYEPFLGAFAASLTVVVGVAGFAGAGAAAVIALGLLVPR